jgi:uncharacterized membrane protein
MATRPDLPRTRSSKPPIAARTRVLGSILIGIVLAVPVSLATSWDPFLLVSWDFASLAFVASIWIRIWNLDADQTARIAVREDPTRATADLLTLGAAVASLAAVGAVLGRAAASHGSTQVLLAGLAVVSIVLSWWVVHTVFTLRYARLYYQGTEGGIDFNEADPPGYSDFAYLAFTIGMTFQVSDTDLKTKLIRKTALRHGLLSFMFSTCILATTVNLIGNL